MESPMLTEAKRIGLIASADGRCRRLPGVIHGDGRPGGHRLAAWITPLTNSCRGGFGASVTNQTILVTRSTHWSLTWFLHRRSTGDPGLETPTSR